MEPFLNHLGPLFLHPRRAFRKAAEQPRPWAGALWGLLPAVLAMFLTSWAATRRWFDPYYAGMAGLVFGGAWVLSLASLAVAARLLGGRPRPEALTEASGLAWTPILAGLLLLLPVFLTTEGRNFVELQRVEFSAVTTGGALWGAFLTVQLFREVAGFSLRRALGGYLVSLVVTWLVLGAAIWLFVWTH